MLPVDQVIPFIRHESPLVIDLALRYLEHIRHPARLTGDFILGALQESPGARLKRWLGHFAVSPAVVEYAFQAIEDRRIDSDEWWPWSVLLNLTRQTWTPQIAERIQSLRVRESWIRQALDQRARLLCASPDELRDRFLADCAHADAAGLARSQQDQTSGIVENLAGFAESRQWAFERLSLVRGTDCWEEIWLVELLVLMGDRRILDFAMDRFTSVDPEKDESLLGALGGSVARLCDETDLPRIAGLLARSSGPHLAELLCGLSQLRVKEFEPLLTRAGRESEDPWHRTLAFVGLCEMLAGTDEALSFVADTTETDRFELDYCEPAELAVPLGIIIGKPFPQAREWERVARSRGSRWGAPDPSVSELAFARILHAPGEGAPLGEIDSMRPFVPEGPLEPLSRGPKTGRNDPCPCGSGKKYKKCCLSSATKTTSA